MLRCLPIVFALIAGAVWAQDETPARIAPRPLASAIEAMEAGRWDVALQLAARDGPAATGLIEWYRLNTGLGTPLEILTFLEENAHWPRLDQLRRKAEPIIIEAEDAQVLAFFQDHPPQTGPGVLRLIEALINDGQIGEAEVTAVLTWRTMQLSDKTQLKILASLGPLLEPHHQARIDMMLWRGLENTQMLLPLVSDEARETFELRKKIIAGGSNADELALKVTKLEQPDPGLAHAAFNRLIRLADADKAIDLILAHSRTEDGLGEPARWAGWRRNLARGQMRQGNAQKAYDLAAVHQLTEGSSYADLEWLSGYLALRYLNAPDAALIHFERFRDAVETPISLGRAGYWIGRAHEALGDAEAAQKAYEMGAKYQTSFYGLLAAEKAGVSFPAVPKSGDTPQAWRAGGIVQNDLFQVAVLAIAVGQLNLAETFLVHLAATATEPELQQLGAALDELNQPHLQVMVGKAAAKRGIVVPAPYYALHPMAKRKLAAPAELALAIARRESEFDPSVISHAGARGLMQVMPGTAQEMAGELGIKYDSAKLTTDWHYNARLGAKYLAQVSEKFDGNIILIAAAYNAGPSRPTKWMDEYGDPRSGVEEMIDWIEHIPFRETRNYVMRVSESLPIYRARLGKTALPVPFTTELVGRSFE